MRWLAAYSTRARLCAGRSCGPGRRALARLIGLRSRPARRWGQQAVTPVVLICPASVASRWVRLGGYGCYAISATWAVKTTTGTPSHLGRLPLGRQLAPRAG